MKTFLSPLYALPAVAVALMTLILTSVMAHMQTLNSGREITVPAMGYDPRAVLLGHYVRLVPDVQSELSEKESLAAIEAFDLRNESWSTVEGWVVMEKDETGWRATQLLKDQPDADPSEARVLLHGQIAIRRERTLDGNVSDILSVTPPVEIDRYYANVDEALAIEEILRNADARGDVRLILSVSKTGKAQLKGIEVNGDRKVMGWW